MVDKLPLATTPLRGSAGKRGPSGPIVTTSDEEENSPVDDLPKIVPCPLSLKSSESETILLPASPCEQGSADGYESVSSPGGSSTASGPTIIRPPGFSHRAQEVTKPRVKKKKTASVLLSMRETPHDTDVMLAKPKPKKDPLPMKLRALPQSFFQQPNVPNHISPGTMFPTLPPLFTRETDEDVSALRPISPTSEESPKEKTTKKPSRNVTEWKISQADSDSLFRLFDKVSMEKPRSYIGQLTQKRYRPRRPVPQSNKAGLLLGDPNMMDAVAEKLLPQLSLERRKHMSIGHTTLQLITLKEGDKSVTLPTLAMEQNYSQMLSELVMNI